MKNRPLAISALTILATASIFAQNGEDVTAVKLQKVHAERPVMGTTFQITTYSTQPEKVRQAVDAAFAKAAEIEQIASDYRPDSELNLLCRAAPGQAHQISPLLFDLLKKSLLLAEKTEGVFDPTLGPLTQLWRETRRVKMLPNAAVLIAAKDRCGYKNLILDENKSSVTLLKKGMQLDLGGIAKGYTADAMFEVMKTAGFPQTMVAAGGDVRLGDSPPDHDGWKVGVRTNSDQADAVITLENCAISTSGDLHQWVEIGAKRYAHIVDPATGLGLTSGAAASVIAPTASETDPLATAACLLPDAEKFFSHRNGTSLRLLREGKPAILTGAFKAIVP